MPRTLLRHGLSLSRFVLRPPTRTPNPEPRTPNPEPRTSVQIQIVERPHHHESRSGSRVVVAQQSLAHRISDQLATVSCHIVFLQRPFLHPIFRTQVVFANCSVGMPRNGFSIPPIDATNALPKSIRCALCRPTLASASPPTLPPWLWGGSRTPPAADSAADVGG